ncbi:MAG: hypothetical protein LBM99_00985 [Bacillales bacterium]|jgi:hypothetical protein|nr:hypothetical protein [Bacillales bacterium]
MNKRNVIKKLKKENDLEVSNNPNFEQLANILNITNEKVVYEKHNKVFLKYASICLSVLLVGVLSFYLIYDKIINNSYANTPPSSNSSLELNVPGDNGLDGDTGTEGIFTENDIKYNNNPIKEMTFNEMSMSLYVGINQTREVAFVFQFINVYEYNNIRIMISDGVNDYVANNSNFGINNYIYQKCSQALEYDFVIYYTVSNEAFIDFQLNVESYINEL